MPTTRRSRLASATIASPNTVVYCGGAGTAGAGFAGAGDPLAGEGGVSPRPLSPPPRAPPPHAAGAPARGGGDPAALAGRDGDAARPAGDQRAAQPPPQRAHVVAVD